MRCLPPFKYVLLCVSVDARSTASFTLQCVVTGETTATAGCHRESAQPLRPESKTTQWHWLATVRFPRPGATRFGQGRISAALPMGREDVDNVGEGGDVKGKNNSRRGGAESTHEGGSE